MKIGIIGIGMVGNAVRNGSHKCELICTYDKFHEDRCRMWGLASQTDLCFICVPTPTTPLGTQDLGAVIDACRHLRGFSTEGYRGVVVIKSTVLPGVMRSLKNLFPDLRLVHNPEFLCEKTASVDYINQKIILLSGDMEDVRVMRRYAALCLPDAITDYTDVYEITEWAKYLHNCMLPVQLSFLNEMHQMIGNQNIFNDAVRMAQWFGNVGALAKVPGPDGKMGWGGSCFPKDTRALETLAVLKGIPTATLSGAIQTNNLIRNGVPSK